MNERTITELAQLTVLLDVGIELRLGNHHLELFLRIIGSYHINKLVVAHIDLHLVGTKNGLQLAEYLADCHRRRELGRGNHISPLLMRGTGFLPR